MRIEGGIDIVPARLGGIEAEETMEEVEGGGEGEVDTLKEEGRGGREGGRGGSERVANQVSTGRACDRRLEGSAYRKGIERSDR